MRKNQISLPKIYICHHTNPIRDLNVITLKYEISTRRFWRVATVLVEVFLNFDVVKETLQAQPLTAASWENANAVLRRLSMAVGSVNLTVDETQDCADVIAMMCHCYFSSGKNWKRSGALLLLWGGIARYQFVGKFQNKIYEKMDRRDSAVRCYERFMKEVKGHSPWITLHDVYSSWLKMRHYQGSDERLLDLQRRLEGISKMYRLALEAGGLENYTIKSATALISRKRRGGGSTRR